MVWDAITDYKIIISGKKKYDNSNLNKCNGKGAMKMTDLQCRRDQFRNEIKASSNKRILRKQLELLAEVSHSEIELGLPELTKVK